jgi:hypothetical protein
MSSDIPLDIVETLRRCVEKGKTQPVPALHEFKQCLLDSGLGWYAVVHHKTVAVHYKNRSGLGLIVDDTFDLASSFFTFGFHPSECDLWYHELAHTDKQSVALNMKLVAESEGRLAALLPHEVRYVSSSGGHTTATIRNCALEACGRDERMCRDGAYCKSKIAAHDPLFGQAMNDGLRAFVVSSRVEVALPNVIDFIEAASNEKKCVGQSTTEVQYMLRINGLVRSMKQGDGSIDVGEFKKVSCRTPSPHNMCAMPMFHLIRKFDGDAFHTTRLATFAARYKSRRVGSTFIDEIQGLDLGATQKLEFFRFAVLACQYSCPNDQIEDTTAAWLSKGDVRGMGAAQKHKPVVIKADGMLRALHDIVEQHKGGDANEISDKVEVLYMQCACRMVYTVLGKKHRDRRAFESVEECASLCVEELSKLVAASIDNPWKTHVPKEASDPPAVTLQVRDSSYDNATMLREHGFSVGGACKRKQNRTVTWDIVSVSDNKVSVASDSLSARIKIDIFVIEWAPCERPKTSKD